MIRAQPLEESDQAIDCDRFVIEIAFEIDDFVKRDAGKPIGRARRSQREQDKQKEMGAA